VPALQVYQALLFDVHRLAPPRLDPIVAAGHAFAGLWGFSIAFPNAVEDGFGVGTEFPLIVLECQHVVGSFVGNGSFRR
jgi:hypothetical protein